MKPKLSTRLFRYLQIASVIIVVAIALIWLVLQGYFAAWTGFGDFTKSDGEFVRGKTLWDWMQLLIIPLSLSVGVFLLNRAERDNEREIATARQEDAAIQNYLDRMSQLLLEKKLRTSRNKEVRNVARTRTLTVLWGLGASQGLSRLKLGLMTRKASVLKFLYEAGLINKDNTIVDLKEANFVGAYLNYVDLREANLEGADLLWANLEGARLEHANLEGAHLGEANLAGASLREADLRRADLGGARLERTNLEGANLLWANLEGADLKGADLKGAALKGAVLVHADLKYADLEGADLKPTVVRSTNLKGANLFFANLKDACLEGANLEGADLRRANLQGTDLKDAKVTNQQLSQAGSLKGATMPDGTKHD